MLEYSDEIVREMRSLRRKGSTDREIARRFDTSITTVRRWLAGEHPKGTRTEGTREYAKAEVRKVTGGISRDEIENVRRRTYVGAGIIIRTQKSADPDASKGNLTGVPRMAIVTDVSNPIFCMVRLQSGTLESVLWSDLVLQAREKAEGKCLWEKKA